MKFLRSLTAVIMLVTIVAGCKKDDDTPARLIEGKWIVSNTNILGSDVAGDGSYLQFDACSPSCTGVEYMAGDGTTGVITYTINEEGTLLTIVDNSSDGGSWNATWDVLELKKTPLKITASTFLGNMTVTFSK